MMFPRPPAPSARATKTAGGLALVLLAACSSNPSTSGNVADGGTTGSSPNLPQSNAFADCDQQPNAITEVICGSKSTELWTCPAGHAKLPRCTLSTQRDSFCCPLTPPPACESVCAAPGWASCRTSNTALCVSSCAASVKRIDLQSAGTCHAAVVAYLECVTTNATSCKDDGPFAAECEDLGEVSIVCQSRGSERAPDKDASCAAAKLPSRAFTAATVNQLSPTAHCSPLGGVLCCAYP